MLLVDFFRSQVYFLEFKKFQAVYQRVGTFVLTSFNFLHFRLNQVVKFALDLLNSGNQVILVLVSEQLVEKFEFFKGLVLFTLQVHDVELELSHLQFCVVLV